MNRRVMVTDAIVGGALGLVLSTVGATLGTWQFWVVMVGVTLWRNSPRASE